MLKKAKNLRYGDVIYGTVQRRVVESVTVNGNTVKVVATNYGTNDSSTTTMSADSEVHVE